MYFVRVMGILHFEYIYLIPVILCASASIRSFKLNWPKPFRLFSAFLLTTLLIEIFAISWEWVLHDNAWWSFSQSNLWVYNGFLPVRHLFLTLFFYYIVTSGSIKQIIIWTTPSFILFSLVNYGFIQTPFQVNSHSIILSNVLITLIIVLFFKQVLEDKRVIRLATSTEIWIALGSLLYYSGSLPFFIFFNRLIESDSVLLGPLLFINDGLNVFMYSLFVIAFLCSPKIQK